MNLHLTAKDTYLLRVRETGEFLDSFFSSGVRGKPSRGRDLNVVDQRNET